jgi:hypothetical protein
MKPIIVYASKDAAIAVTTTSDEKRAAFESGGLPIYHGETAEEVAAVFEPITTRVGDNLYLTDFLDRPFVDVDELIALRDRLERGS